MISELKKLFKKNNGYLTRKELPNLAEYKSMLRMIAKGEVERIKPGVFRLCSYEVALMIDIESIVPNGILCMYSAFFHYGLTVQIPQAICVAIEKKRRVVLPTYPPIQLYYWKKEYQELGVITKNIDDYNIKIYNLEKSVCDAVKFRNKIGIETTAEIIRNYLNRQERNFTKLMQYAKIMRIEKIMRTYIEIQL